MRNSVWTFGAGERNRTVATSLEGWSSTTELLPQNGQSRIRTYEAQAQEIYSLSSLTTWVSAQTYLNKIKVIWAGFKFFQNAWSKLECCPIWKFKLARGLEPPTGWLQVSCSTNWATPANFYILFRKVCESLLRDASKILTNYFILTKSDSNIANFISTVKGEINFRPILNWFLKTDVIV